MASDLSGPGRPASLEIIPPRRVDPGEVAGALAGLAGAGETASEVAARTCVLNLVVVTAPGADDSRTIAAEEVSDHLPMRLVAISAVPGSEDAALETSVSAACRIGGDGLSHVCCETVLIKTAGTGIRHLPSALAAYLTADLPIVLWWGCALPPPPDLFAAVSASAVACIFDSSSAPDPRQALVWLHASAGDTLRSRTLFDLAWARSQGWRRFITRIFDRPRAAFPPAAINAITIEQSFSPLHAESILLGAWLAGSLGWRDGVWNAEGSGARVNFTRPGATGQLTFQPVPAADGLPGVETLSLITSAGALRVMRGEGKSPPGTNASGTFIFQPGAMPLTHILGAILENLAPQPDYLAALRQAAAWQA